MEENTKPDDIANGDCNVPHGESVTSSAGEDTQGGSVKIQLIDDPQTASVEKKSVKQSIPSVVDQTEAISKDSTSESSNLSDEQTTVATTEAASEHAVPPSSAENISGEVSIVDSAKETSLAAPATSGSSVEVEVTTRNVPNTATGPGQIASTGNIPQPVESGNVDLSEKHLASETSLAAPAASANTMEVEDPTENIPSIDAVQDPKAPPGTDNEAAKEEERPCADENLMPPPSVAPKAAACSMEVEEPRGNAPSTVTINDQIAEQQQLESEAVEKINSTSLSLLSQYSGSSESESEDTDASKSKQQSSSSSSSDESEDEVKEPALRSTYRKCEDAILVSDAETMDTIAASSDDDEEESQSQAPLRTKGEMLIDELPHIEELTITVPETECKAIGLVDSVVAQIVLVQSIPGVELLNLETVLFLDRGKRPLGKIFDVIGQVNCPIYCVLFNSNQEVVSRNITVGMQVYCAPRTEHTSFIILSELMRYKGSDASWMNDNEPPPHMVEYSDDEAEKTAKRNRKKKSNVNGEQSGETSSQHSQPDRQQQSHQHHHRQEQQHQRQQVFQYPYMPRQQFGRPPPNNRGNFYPRQQSGYSWHHNVNNPRYHHPPQYQQRQPQYQPQYQQQYQQQYQPQQHQQPQPQQQQQQQQFQQFQNTQPAAGAAYLPNPFAMFGQQPPPNPPS
uniref:H/ACA ribonucleoprotein complex non-core subunit NAF1 n=1 Tax=Anopheles atroparvus TaxID=41427 RepID=A0AAG5DKV6_ANOAO